jgi:hypothetical protein
MMGFSLEEERRRIDIANRHTSKHTSHEWRMAGYPREEHVVTEENTTDDS